MHYVNHARSQKALMKRGVTPAFKPFLMRMSPLFSATTTSLKRPYSGVKNPWQES